MTAVKEGHEHHGGVDPSALLARLPQRNNVWVSAANVQAANCVACDAVWAPKPADCGPNFASNVLADAIEVPDRGRRRQ